MPGTELAGGEVGEIADLRQDLTERADDKAGRAPRVAIAHLCLDGPGCVRVCAELRTGLHGGPVEVLGALLDGYTEYRGYRLRVGLPRCQRIDIPEGRGASSLQCICTDTPVFPLSPSSVLLRGASLC